MNPRTRNGLEDKQVVSGDKTAEMLQLLLKLRRWIQFAGVVVALAAVLFTKIWLPGAIDAQIAAGAFLVLFLIFGLIFSRLDAIPRESRASFLLKSLALFCGFVIVAFTLATGVLVANAIKHKVPRAVYLPEEKRLIDLKAELDTIRANYEALESVPDNKPEVNKAAAHLAEKMLVTDDEELGPGVRVFKYENVAYSWAMVAGSASDPHSKLRSAGEILGACDKATIFMSQVIQPGSNKKKEMPTVDWIIDDDAKFRIKRLAAVGYCIRWQFAGDEEARQNVRRIIDEFPEYYRKSEKPESSAELRPCLSDSPKKPNSKQ